MSPYRYIAALSALAFPLLAQASCESLTSDLDAKLHAKGVKHFTLTVKDTGAPTPEGTVIGRCEGDHKVVVYSRGPGSTKRTTEKQPTPLPHVKPST